MAPLARSIFQDGWERDQKDRANAYSRFDMDRAVHLIDKTPRDR